MRGSAPDDGARAAKVLKRVSLIVFVMLSVEIGQNYDEPYNRKNGYYCDYLTYLTIYTHSIARSVCYRDPGTQK